MAAAQAFPGRDRAALLTQLVDDGLWSARVSLAPDVVLVKVRSPATIM